MERETGFESGKNKVTFTDNKINARNIKLLKLASLWCPSR